MTFSLQFAPLYQERVWGGRGLEQYLGRALPDGRHIGESWEIVDRPEAQSVVVGGEWAGRTLRQLIAEHTAEIMGPRWPSSRPFPILVKWLDACDRSSLQVHPTTAIAQRFGGEPKTENWYFAKADPGAVVLAGLKPGVDAARFHAALLDCTAEDLVFSLPTRTEDSLLIPSGVMHSIEAGNFILEIQQNSDTTYRAYDWGRVGIDGKPRKLHIEESLATLTANHAPAPQLVRTDGATTVLADCREFRITRHRLARGSSLAFRAGEQARILSVVEGGLDAAEGRSVARGVNALLPYAGEFLFTASVDSVVLVTDGFSNP